MSEFATLDSDNRLRIPVGIAKHFKPSDRFLVWMDGDTLHLKRLSPSPLKAVEEAPSDEPMSLGEINEIVHEVRRQRHSKKA